MKYIPAEIAVQVTIASTVKARKDLDKADKLLKDLDAEHGHLPVHAKNAQKKKIDKLRKRYNLLRE